MSATRCQGCRLHLEACLCEVLPRLSVASRLALVMHHRELSKTTSTGPLALACLSHAQRYLHGLRDAPLDLGHLHESTRRVWVLFPFENARVLERALVDEDPRPVTLVVPDGTWRQARRIPQRVPGLKSAVRVTLPAGTASSWGVRRAPGDFGLSTFEAIARALGIIESPAVQAQLEAFFQRAVAATLRARGAPVRAGSAPRASSGSSQCGEPTAPRVAEPLSILYQDEFLVAINKPSGMPAHRGWAADGSPALQVLRDQLGRPVWPVHRLDRAASGAMLFALCSEVARDMQALFADGRMAKRYLAVCRGSSSTLGHVCHPLSTGPNGTKRPAATDFKLLGTFERYGLYEAIPRTGRTHQIRRHLRHASHPIVGDVRYGKGEHNRIFRERFGFRRLALHCREMAFTHPRGAGPIAVQAPLSEDLAQLLTRLGLSQHV